MEGSNRSSTILLRSAEEREDTSIEEVVGRELTPEEDVWTGDEHGEGGSNSSSTIMRRSAEEGEDTPEEDVAGRELTPEESQDGGGEETLATHPL